MRGERRTGILCAVWFDGAAVVMDVPVTRYAETERGEIAFQVVGDGPLTILVSKGPAPPVDLMWEEPSLARFMTGLASFSRSIWFDPLGTGSSDAVEEIENRLGEGVVADMESMLDALGCERAVVLDLSLGGFPSILFERDVPGSNAGARVAQPDGAVPAASGLPAGSSGRVRRRHDRAVSALRTVERPFVAVAGEQRAVRAVVRTLYSPLDDADASPVANTFVRHRSTCGVSCRRFVSPRWCVCRDHRSEAHKSASTSPSTSTAPRPSGSRVRTACSTRVTAGRCSTRSRGS